MSGVAAKFPLFAATNEEWGNRRWGKRPVCPRIFRTFDIFVLSSTLCTYSFTLRPKATRPANPTQRTCMIAAKLARPRNRSFLVRPSSACSVLSPPLLTCLHDFVHVCRWPNLENAAVLQGRMLRHELYRMIHVPRLKDENAAELFLGFRKGTVSSCDLAVLPIQSQSGCLLYTSPSPRD